MRLIFFVVIAFFIGSLLATCLSAQTLPTDQNRRFQNDSHTANTDGVRSLSHTRVIAKSTTTDKPNSRVHESYRSGMRTTTILRSHHSSDQQSTANRSIRPVVQEVERATLVGPVKSNAVSQVHFESPSEYEQPKFVEFGEEDSAELISPLNSISRTFPRHQDTRATTPSLTPSRDLIFVESPVDLSVWQDSANSLSGFGVDSYFNSCGGCNEWAGFCRVKEGPYYNPCFALRPGDGDCCGENCGRFSFRHRVRRSRCGQECNSGCQDCDSN